MKPPWKAYQSEVELVLFHRVLDLDGRVDARDAVRRMRGRPRRALSSPSRSRPLDVDGGEIRAILPVALVDGLVRPGAVAAGFRGEDAVFRGFAGVGFLESFLL